jgi:hypothetical protein
VFELIRRHGARLRVLSFARSICLSLTGHLRREPIEERSRLLSKLLKGRLCCEYPFFRCGDNRAMAFIAVARSWPPTEAAYGSGF